MVRKQSVSYSFVKLKVAQKPEVGERVGRGLAAHPTIFTDLPHLPADVIRVSTELNDATSDALSGDKEKKTLREAKEREWDNILRDNADRVAAIAKGDAVMIAMSGYEATKAESIPMPAPGALIDFDAKSGDTAGTITLSTKFGEGGKSITYVVTDVAARVTLTAGVLVITGAATSRILAGAARTATISGLVRGQELVAYGFAVNTTGTGPLSNPVTLAVSK